MKEGRKTTICPRAPNAATRRSYSVALLYAVFLSRCITYTHKDTHTRTYNLDQTFLIQLFFILIVLSLQKKKKERSLVITNRVHGLFTM